ncbi:unnamed protein product [Microthlaspi erraticum]|uniref:RNase H type-1 domain-containing protein n=1 Tax=Microthlaspi erraticum TaxID=1685480 RepID=A0A6D2L4T0_9BRAS|nr:unnamed protein product [Microthlaspi erraticum]
MINLQKSSITFLRKTPEDIRTRVKTTLGIEKEKGHGKYLGLPESFGRRKKDLFTMIVDRIRQRLINYSSRFLSAAGKLTMLKSVLSAIPTYTMFCFKLPVGLCKRIQSTLTRFWWDAKPEKKKMCWVSWGKLTQSKKMGGLGFREIRSFDDGLLAKINWRILQSPNCLLRGKYCHKQDFLSIPITSNSSHGWRGILIGRDLLKNQLGRVIGNGEETSLSDDPWLSLDHSTKPFGPPNLHDQTMKVSALLNDHTKEWDKVKIQETIPHYMKEILAIRPSRQGAPDSFIWLPTKSGEYSVQTGYHIAMAMMTDPDLQQEQPQINWMQDIWLAKCSPKMKVFLWKVVQEAIPLGENLLNRGLIDNACCIHCGDLETTNHLFFHCKFSSKVWKLSPYSKPINPNHLQSFTATLTSSKSWICLPPTGIGAGTLFPWICWAIWKTRNLLLFENRRFTPADTVSKAISEAQEWQLAQYTKQTADRSPNQPNPPLSLPNTITCFTDGAWCKETGIGGFGWIFNNSEGSQMRRGQSVDRCVSSALVTEALAIRSALHQALEEGFTNLHVKSDARDLIRAINLQEQVKEIYGLLFDIHAIASMFTSIDFTFVPRSSNIVADSIAREAKSHLILHVASLRTGDPPCILWLSF